MLKIISNESHYTEVIARIKDAQKYVWIGTADIKDLHIDLFGKTEPFLSLLNHLLKKKVLVRLLHAKEPGPNFRKSFDKYPRLWDMMERQLCPRVHFKIIVIDGLLAYSGSANLTGAGMGMKGKNTRNFETGILTNETILVEQIMQQFDDVWMGKFCKNCGRRKYCPDPIL